MTATNSASPRRGGHLLNSALTVVAEAGYATLSVRSVAAQAGVSPAQVQYYFPTKAQLVGAAFEHASQEFQAVIAGEFDAPPSVERLHRIMRTWLPLDADAERRARVWLAYAAAAVVEPDLAARSSQLDGELRDWLAKELHQLLPDGRPGADIDPPTAAAQLLALIDGLTVHTLTLRLDQRPALVDQVLTSWLDSLIPGNPAEAPS